jgi:hypothetical protein
LPSSLLPTSTTVASQDDDREDHGPAAAAMGIQH